ARSPPHGPGKFAKSEAALSRPPQTDNRSVLISPAHLRSRQCRSVFVYHKGTVMQHRSLLKWTAIAAVSIAITLLLLSLQLDSVSAAKTKARSETQGSLQALTPDGKPARECPLKHT